MVCERVLTPVRPHRDLPDSYPGLRDKISQSVNDPISASVGGSQMTKWQTL